MLHLLSTVCASFTFRSAMQYMTQTSQLLSAISLDDSMPILSFIKKGETDEGLNKRALWLTFVLVSIPSMR